MNQNMNQQNFNQMPQTNVQQPNMNLQPQMNSMPQTTMQQPQINPQPQSNIEEPKNGKKGSKNGVILFLLLVIIGLCGYIAYDKFFAKKDTKEDTSEKEEEKQAEKEENKQEEKEEQKEAEKEEAVIIPDAVKTCSYCSDKIDFTIAYRDNKNFREISSDILLGDKRRTLLLKEDGLYIDESKLIDTTMAVWIDSAYVFRNEVLLVVTDGSDTRSTDYQFYDKDLNPIEVDMTLDKEYSQMRQGTLSSLSVIGDTIQIYGTVMYHGKTIKTPNGTVEICSSDYDGSHDGELLAAEYQMTYLGNGKFSSFKRVKPLGYVGKRYCDE